MTTTARTAAGDGLPEDLKGRLAKFKDAGLELSEARWLIEAVQMTLAHPDALNSCEDLPITALLKVVLDRAVTANLAAAAAMDELVGLLDADGAAQGRGTDNAGGRGDLVGMNARSGRRKMLP